MNPKQKIEKFIEEGESFIGQNMTSSDARFQSWNNALVRFTEKLYGVDSTTASLFKKRCYSLNIITGSESHSSYVKVFERKLNTTIADLRRLLDEVDDDISLISGKEIKENRNGDLQPIQVNVTNTNNNNNTNINNNLLNVMSFQEIRDQIEDNTYLDDDSKSELINKLSEIEELCNSKESKSQKWSKARAILAFVLDKGADIAIMFIPKILEAIM